MAKQNFKPQRPARKVKLKADKQKRHKVNKKVAADKPVNVKAPAVKGQWQLPPDYFDNLPPTHNAFIGYSKSDTIENVIAGIDVIRELVTPNTDHLAFNGNTNFGLLWFIQNIRNALKFELDFKDQR